MFRLVALPDEIPGRLYLHAMPGFFESWSTFERYAQIAALDLIVCLTRPEEVEISSPAYAEAIRTKQLPCFRINYAITDFSKPTNSTKYSKLVRAVAEKIREGNNVLVHCHAGIGRTGLFASCILHQLGLGLSYLEIYKFIDDAGSNPASRDEISYYCNTAS